MYVCIYIYIYIQFVLGAAGRDPGRTGQGAHASGRRQHKQRDGERANRLGDQEYSTIS